MFNYWHKLMCPFFKSSFDIEADPNLEKNMKVFILYAHPEPNASFQGALLKKGVETLESEGHEVIVSDLYKMGFNPVASAEDIYYAPLSLTDYSMTVSRNSRWKIMNFPMM